MPKEQSPFEAFACAVLTHVPRANGDEWHDIKNELTAHLEDRADVLEARGIPPDQAQAQAIAWMGDPQEIGQAINKELSIFWGWVGRLCATLVVFLMLCSVIPLFFVGLQVAENLMTRFNTDLGDFSDSKAYNVVYENTTGETFQAGDITIVLHGYRVYEQPKGRFYLETYFSGYANNPFDQVYTPILWNFTLDGAYTQGGTAPYGDAGGALGYGRYAVEQGDTQWVLRNDYYGLDLETTLTMDWGAVS